MAGDRLSIAFNDLGLGAVLKGYQLIVPRNQRSYAWEEAHVQTLFEDLSAAKQKDNPTYFLGTIVLTHGSKPNEHEVADGQQRLATTAILIGAIRDHLFNMGDSGKRAAEKYTSDFLLTYDPRTEENFPKLRLNTVDADFFSSTILPSADDPSRGNERQPTTNSHTRLLDAAKLAKSHVENIVAQYRRDLHATVLYDWIEFFGRAPERPRPVFPAHHEPAGERAVPHRSGAHDGRPGRHLLPQLPRPADGHHPRHRRHLRRGARPTAAVAVQRLLRHAVLPAGARLPCGERQAGGGSPAAGQDAVGRRGPHPPQAQCDCYYY